MRDNYTPVIPLEKGFINRTSDEEKRREKRKNMGSTDPEKEAEKLK